MDSEFKKLLKGAAWAATGDRTDPEDASVSPVISRTTGFQSSYSSTETPARTRINQILRELYGAAKEVAYGVSEYDAEVPYQTNSIVQSGGELYRATAIHNPASPIAPTDTGQTFWTALTGGSFIVTGVPATMTASNLVIDGERADLFKVYWNPPDDNNSPIDRYQLSYSTTRDFSGTATVVDNVTLGHTVQISGRNSDQYFVRMRARNAEGWGAWVTGATAGAPVRSSPLSTDAIATFTTIAGDRRVTLHWAAPYTRGLTISKYNIQWRNSVQSFSSSERNLDVATGTTSITISPPLTNNTQYFWRINTISNRNTTATGAVQTESPMAPPVAPETAPAKPIKPVATQSGVNALTARLTSAPSDGGATITQYDWQVKRSTDATFSSANDQSTSTPVLLLTDITLTGSLQFRVRAVNSVGNGAWSDNSDAVEPIRDTAPNQPDIVAIPTKNSGEVFVALDAIPVDNNAAITGYTFDHKLKTASDWTEGSSSSVPAMTFTGLTGGSAYQFRASATNSEGTSAESAIVEATPVAPGVAATVPDAPVITAIASGQTTGSVVVSVSTAIDGNGAEVSQYRFDYKKTTDSSWTAGAFAAASSVQLTGLEVGTQYQFRAYAKNSVGNSASSVIVTATPITIPATKTAPSAPLIVAIAPNATGQIFVAVRSVPSDGGADITGVTFQVRRSASGSTPAGTWSTFSSGNTGTAATATGLTPGVSYDFRVSLTNSIGTSPSSAVAPATPIRVTPAPSAPTKPVISASPAPGGNAVVVSISSVIGGNGANVSSLAYQYRLSTATNWTSGGTTTATVRTISGLTAGSAYQFRVQATNSAGTSAWSDTATATPIAPAAAATVPDAPVITAVASGSTSGSVVVSVARAIDGNGSQVGQYRIDRKKTSSATWTNGTFGTASSVQFTGLEVGTEYQFRAYARNSVGTSAVSSTVAATPITIPATPTAPSAPAITAYPSSVTGNVVIAINSVPSDGGSNITGVTYQMKLSTANTWTSISTGTTATALLRTGLTVGSTYQFRVSLTNAIGTSSYSSVAQAVPVRAAPTPAVPTTPQITATARTGGNAVYVAMSNVLDDNGANISAITYQYKLSTASNWTSISSLTSSLNISGLTAGSAYQFRVRATNSVGTTSWSNVATATPIAAPVVARVPNAPVITAVASGSSSGTISVCVATAIEGNGAQVSQYRFDRKKTSDANWTQGTFGTASATIFSGLDVGAEYQFRALAKNSVGNSAASATVAATPITVPATPTAPAAPVITTEPSATQGEVFVFLTSIPSDGGSDITSFTYQIKLSTATEWTTFSTGTSTAASRSGLTIGSTYDFRVSATNAIGTSSYSATVQHVPAVVGPTAALPDVPVLVATPVATGRAIVVSFRDAIDDNGSDISSIQFQYKLSTASNWTSSSSSSRTTVTISGLTAGSTYDFRARATNTVGTTAWSSVVQAVPLATPTTPSAPDAPVLTAIASGSSSGSIMVAVSTVGDGNGAEITQYRFDRKKEADANWTTGAFGTSSAIVYSGLSVGSAFQFRAIAKNSVGNSSLSSVVTATPITIPATPTAPSAPTITATPTGTSGQILVAIASVPSDGGADISSITYQMKLSTASTWTNISTGGTATAITRSSLSNSSTYDFRVSLTNSVGTSSYSATVQASPVAPEVSPIAPSTPTIIVTPVPDVQSMVVSIRNFPGVLRDDVDSFNIQYRRKGVSTWTSTTRSTATTTITGLTAGQVYQFRANLQNSTGTSSYSAVVEATVQSSPPSSSAPSAPALVANVVNSNTTIGLGIQRRVNDNNSDITSFTYQRRQGSSGTWSTIKSGNTDTSFTISSGMTAGTLYQFRAYAINARGTSSASNIVSATPVIIPTSTVPGKPLLANATISGTRSPIVGETWVSVFVNGVPVDGGSPITAFEWQWRLLTSSTWTTLSGNTGFGQRTALVWVGYGPDGVGRGNIATRLRWRNANGWGSYSNPLNTFVI